MKNLRLYWKLTHLRTQCCSAKSAKLSSGFFLRDAKQKWSLSRQRRERSIGHCRNRQEVGAFSHWTSLCIWNRSKISFICVQCQKSWYKLKTKTFRDDATICRDKFWYRLMLCENNCALDGLSRADCAKIYKSTSWIFVSPWHHSLVSFCPLKNFNNSMDLVRRTVKQYGMCVIVKPNSYKA